ncbi:MAG: hypothetical protein HC936_19210 [Leptolyngbyaceae cyanobacterium SU_3_3]|nr:hypothetical protein [Leptolyngbyaceae cyanobacterium SU_3_3]
MHSPEPASRGEWSGRPFEQLQSQQNKLPRKMEAMYADLLNQSQAAASRDQLTEAIQTIAGIPTNSQHHELAQQLQEDWSRELVRQATNRFQQGEVAPAIALLKSIPITSQWHDRAIELRQRWDQQAKLLNQATAATAAADWQARSMRSNLWKDYPYITVFQFKSCCSKLWPNAMSQSPPCSKSPLQTRP